MKEYLNSLINGSTQEKAGNCTFWKNHPRTIPFQRASGYGIGFLQFLSIWKKQVDIKIFHHIHFKWVEKYYVARQKTTNHFFAFFQFHIRRTQQISHWTITAEIPRINHFRRYEKNITHDDCQLSTKPTRDHEDGGITETEDFLRKRVYSKTWCVIFCISSLVYYDIWKFHRI